MDIRITKRTVAEVIVLNMEEGVSNACCGVFSSGDDFCICQVVKSLWDFGFVNMPEVATALDRLEEESYLKHHRREQQIKNDYSGQMRSIVSLCRWSHDLFSFSSWRDPLFRVTIGEYLRPPKR